MSCRICGLPIETGTGCDVEPMHRLCLDELARHSGYDDDDDEMNGGDELDTTAVCFFCGDVTTDGLMLMPEHPTTLPYFPICKPCMARAIRGGGLTAGRSRN